MKTLLLSPMLVLLAASAGAQQQVAPYGQPNSSLPGFSDFSSGGQTHRASTTEDFEAYSVAFGGAENIGVLALDDTTITGTGQGPLLVQDGVTYSCAGGSLQWNGDTYFGLATKTFLANSTDGVLNMGYDSAQSNITFNMHSFNGYPDTATVYIYDTSGALVFTSAPISVPGASPVNFNYSSSNIGSVLIDSATYSWSVCIDRHVYGGGLSLVTNGVAGGNMTFDVSGATATGPVALVYAFGLGSHSGTNPITGNTLVTGLSSTGFTVGYAGAADGAGNMSYNTNVPGGAAGLVHVQAIDLLSDGLSNVVSL